MKALAGDDFFADARVAEARRLLQQVMAEHQGALMEVRAPDPERKIGYDELIRQFNEARGGAIYYPYLGSGFGRGPLVELADGSVKFDLISGIGVHHFGHGHPRLMTAALDAALRDTIMQGNLQQNVESTAIARELVARAAPGSAIAHCFLTTSGAMANENALKLAFHKRPGTSRVLAFAHTFAGRTMALSAITDKAAYRTGLPAALAVDYLPYFDAGDAAGSTERALAALQAHAGRYPGQHAALWCELVLGEGGFYPGDAAFFAALAGAARQRNIVVVADEVQTFGRTSRLFGFQHFGLEALVDIVTVGKMLQLCATLFTDALKPAPGIISQTFTASTAAIFAAQAIVRELLADDLFGEQGKNMRVNAQFAACFGGIARRHPGWITGPHGLGAMIAFTAFDGSEEKAKKLLRALFDIGVIAFYNGSRPTRIRMLPPVPVLTDAHIETIGGLLESALAQVAEGRA